MNLNKLFESDLGKREFKRRELETELGHEEAMNNHKITINGRDWKVFKQKSTAEKAAATIRQKNPKKDVRIYATMEPVTEGRMEGANVLAALERIVDNKSAGVVKFSDGKSKIDMYTASAIMQVYNAVNDENKKKIERMIDTRTGFMAIAKFAFKRRTNEDTVTEADDQSEVVRLGRILMNMATTQKDEALSNAMATLGSELTKFGTPTGARHIADLNKRTGLNVSTIEKMMAMADKFGDEGLDKIRDPEPEEDTYETKLGEKYKAHKNKMSEGLDQEKFQSAEARLLKYAQERGGIDKADFMEVAKMMGQIGRLNILQAGQILSRLNRKLQDMDTEPRELVYRILQDVGLMEDSMSEGYSTLPNIDTDRYQERPGLEGPFRADNGKVVYYDAKEGMYYDPDTDMYISQSDWDSMNEEATANIQDYDDADDTVLGNVMVDGKKVESFIMYGTTGGVDAFDRTFNTIDDMLAYAEERFEGVAEAVEEEIVNERSKFEQYKNLLIIYDPKTMEVVKTYPHTNASAARKDSIQSKLPIVHGADFMELMVSKHGMTNAVAKAKDMLAVAENSELAEAYRDEIMIGDHVITKKGGQMQGVVTGFSTKSGDTRVMFKHKSGKVYATYPENLTILNKTNESNSAPQSQEQAITEAQFDEAAGEKDACYHKVKSRYKVWPSAYASGALVQCRKVGAANWGKKKK